ncbi:hypothetical protein ACLKA6_010070 [Drosophila palustris]
MSPHVSFALLIGLILGVGICHTASVEKLRIARDTRNIPSNMFKPVNSASNGNQNETLPSSDNYSDGDSFSEHSTGEAHAVTGPVRPKGVNPFQSSREEDYDDRTPYRPNIPRYYNPSRINDPFPSGLRSSNFESSFNTRRSNLGFSDPNFGSSRPLRGQTIPLIATGIAPSLTPSGFPDSGFGPSSSNNFYRSESYSYNSDGNGPPQIERNVFDSRLGHGLSNRNF